MSPTTCSPWVLAMGFADHKELQDFLLSTWEGLASQTLAKARLDLRTVLATPGRDPEGL